MIVLKGVATKFSGTIEFSDIPEEAYRKLEEFINNLNSNKVSEAASKPSVEEEQRGVNEDKGEKEEDSKRPPETVPKSKKYKKPRTLDYVAVDWNGLEKKIQNIIDRATTDPEHYEFRYALASDFLEENKEELEGVTAQSVGVVMQKLGYEKKGMKNPKTGIITRMRQWPMKREETEKEEKQKIKLNERGHVILSIEENNDPKNADSNSKRWSLKKAKMLKDKRTQVGLSITELADLIGYPIYAIQAWEKCEAIPSAEAIEVLCSKFGNEFKDNQEKAS